jgi:hypothetical protein
MGYRTALLINCSTAEATTIRNRSELQRRSVSGYVLNIVMRAVSFEETLSNKIDNLRLPQLPLHRPARLTGPRTTLLLRCSLDEARRIRSAAKRRGSTISGFVLHSLRRSWNVSDGLLDPLPPLSLRDEAAQGSSV